MVEEIMPNLYRIEIPLPHNPLRAVNSYVIKSRDRNLIIDTGFNISECMKAMRSGLERLDVDLRKTDFFITHHHSDHLDLASSIATNSSAIYLNKPDAEAIRSSGQWEERMQSFARMSGFPENEIQEVIERFSWRKYQKSGPSDFTVLREGETLDVYPYRLGCVETPGHTRGHMCLYESEKKILLSGDHILSEISPNISLWHYEDNPLKKYLESLDKIHKFNVELVLPGHRRPFADCKTRIQELKHHHEIRAKEVLSILREGNMDAFQIASQMTWDLSFNSWGLFPSPQRLFATTEALSHLKYLEEKGLVKKEIEAQKMIFSLN